MIPTVSLTDLETAQTEAIELLRASLRENCLIYLDARTELGPAFFARLHDQTGKFFALPDTDKMSVDIERSRNYRGYVRQGTEYTNGVPDLKESFEFGRETQPPGGERLPWFDLLGSNQWPDPLILPDFRPVISGYLDEIVRIATAVLRALLLTLDQPLDPERDVTGGNLCCYSRLIYYCDPSGYRAQDTRLQRHTDSGLITIGLQNAPGLEAETVAGDWIEVCPEENVFTVFPADLAEAWTRGYYRSCAHRVRNAALRGERISYASFVLPDLLRGLAPLDRERCRHLTPSDSVRSTNTWLAGGSELPGGTPIGQLEWERTKLIFPHQTEGTAHD